MHRAAPRPVERPDSKVQSLVAEYIQEKERSEGDGSKSRRKPLNRQALTAVLAIVCLAAWFAPYPTPHTAPPVDAKVERASARVALFLAAQSVVYFRTARGRLPRNLPEAGLDRSLVKYFPGRDGSFVLQVSVRNHTLSYDSDLPATSILRNAEEIIAETAH